MEKSISPFVFSYRTIAHEPPGKGRHLSSLSPGGFLDWFAFRDLSQEPLVNRHQPGHFTFELLIGNSQLGYFAVEPRLSLVAFDDFPPQISDRLLRPVRFFRRSRPPVIIPLRLPDITLVGLLHILTVTTASFGLDEFDAYDRRITRETICIHNFGRCLSPPPSDL